MYLCVLEFALPFFFKNVTICQERAVRGWERKMNRLYNACYMKPNARFMASDSLFDCTPPWYGLYGSCQVFWKVFQRSISTNCKVNSDIQTASIISKAQGTGWHNRSNTSLVLNGEERHFWIMSKMSQEEYLTCHVYLLSTLDSRAFNQPSSSLPLPKFGQTIAIRLSIYCTNLKRSCIGPFASLSQQKSTSV